MAQLIRNPLIVSLDVDTKNEAVDLAKNLSQLAGCYKLGPRLIHRYGDEIVRAVTAFGPVFVDCKFFDIPSTMLAAIQACFDSGASLATIHTLAGMPALKELARLETKLNSIRPFKILCVTILTSWDEKSVPSVLKPQSIGQHVTDLATMVHESGLTGLVCSSQELNLVRSQPSFANFFTVVPGIRMDHHAHGDQKRAMTPKEAMKLGASALVVGRPIIEAKDPVAETRLFLQQIS